MRASLTARGIAVTESNGVLTVDAMGATMVIHGPDRDWPD